jgi:hypothetical protein
MPDIPFTRLKAKATEPRRVRIPVKSTLRSTDIASAVLNIEGRPDVALSIGADSEGYLLTADPVVMPAAGVYAWSAEATESGGATPVVVAEGELHVDALV